MGTAVAPAAWPCSAGCLGVEGSPRLHKGPSLSAPPYGAPFLSAGRGRGTWSHAGAGVFQLGPRFGAGGSALMQTLSFHSYTVTASKKDLLGRLLLPGLFF